MTSWVFAEYLCKISRRHSAKGRGVSPLVFAKDLHDISRRKKLVCTNLREILRGFLRESSRLRIFVHGVNARKRSIFLGLICIL